jgi:hypothetical protein
MDERGVDFEQLGALLGYAADTVRQAVSTNIPKTRRMEERIAAWLEDPDAVAMAAEAPVTAAAPFRAGGGARARAGVTAV